MKRLFEIQSDLHMGSCFFEAWGLLGCPGKEVRINGDRINGLFHLLNPTYIEIVSILG